MNVGRPKNNNYPPFMFSDGGRGGFMVRNPITGKRKRFSAAQEALARQTAQRLAEWVQTIRQKNALDAGRPLVEQLVDRWEKERLAFMPWDESTRQTARWRLARIRREIGQQTLVDADCLSLGAWLTKTALRAQPFNKWRDVLILLWRFGVAQKLCASNEAEKVEPRSTSRKIESNRKVRQQLDVEGFKLIWAKAPAWLQVAMDASLVTLQARNEVCHMRHTDFRSGHLYVIRDKVAANSDMAFIRIGLTPELEEIRARARQLDDVVSPFLIHRTPARRQRRWMEGKPHWTYVEPSYLSKAFADARDQVERFTALPERERPTFHEIRGLGSRLYRKLGMTKDAIRALMTHSHERTTEIYLELGPQALTDDHFQVVSAPFSRQELLGVGGVTGVTR